MNPNYDDDDDYNFQSVIFSVVADVKLKFSSFTSTVHRIVYAAAAATSFGFRLTGLLFQS